MAVTRRAFLAGAPFCISLGAIARPRAGLLYGDVPSLFWHVNTLVAPSSTALMSLNRAGFRELGAQRSIPRYITAAIVLGDARLARIGMDGLRRMFQYRSESGFPFRPAGKLNGEVWILARSLTSAFFLMELLQAWHASQSLPFGRDYREELRSFIDLCQEEALEVSSNLDRLVIENISAANRVMICVRTAQLIKLAFGTNTSVNRYINVVMSLQTPHGYFLEKNGHDLSYNSALLVFGSQLLMTRWSSSLAKGLERCAEWIGNRVTRDGEVLKNGDSRTNGQERASNGKIKGPNYVEISQALIVGAVMTGDGRLLDKAVLVWSRYVDKTPTYKLQEYSPELIKPR